MSPVGPMSNRPRKVKVPDLRSPDGLCFAQDTRPYSPTSMARCGFQRWHKGKHSWERELTPKQIARTENAHDSRKNGDPVNLTPYVWPTMRMLLTDEERLAFGVRLDLPMTVNIVRAISGLKYRLQARRTTQEDTDARD